MTTRTKIIAAAGLALALGLGAATVARAQSSVVSAALADGTIGEQDDGYLGFRGSPSGDVRAEVNNINIQRRALYTEKAAAKGVSVSEMAAAHGCRTLARTGVGRAYAIGGSWSVRGAGDPAPAPAYCPQVS